jgi:hypothetical protein
MECRGRRPDATFATHRRFWSKQGFWWDVNQVVAVWCTPV